MCFERWWSPARILTGASVWMMTLDICFRSGYIYIRICECSRHRRVLSGTYKCGSFTLSVCVKQWASSASSHVILYTYLFQVTAWGWLTISLKHVPSIPQRSEKLTICKRHYFAADRLDLIYMYLAPLFTRTNHLLWSLLYQIAILHFPENPGMFS